MKSRLITVTITILLSVSLQSQEIVRKGFLGARIVTANDSVLKSNSIKHGVLIDKIVKKEYSKKHKLREGDILISINGKRCTKARDVTTILKDKRSGNEVTFNIIRKKREKTIKGILPAKPMEKSDKHDIIYDQFSFNKGAIRVIVDKPKTDKKVPAVLFIQGYTCSSLDNTSPDHPYIKLVKGLCDKGYAVMRMEKPGMGDNYNTSDCSEIDFHTEVEAFSLALEKLKTYDFVDKDNVFIWGHSMGGVIAPIIAAQQNVKGVAVYGCTIRPWRDYLNDLFRIQSIMVGADPVENDKGMKAYAKILYGLFIDKKHPDLLAKDPELKEALKNGFSYDGKGHIWTRHYKYIVQIDDYSLFEQWSKVKSNVLVFWGDADLEAFSEWDHKQITDVVNKYNPGKATYYNIKNTTHSFAKVKSMQHGIKNRNWKYITSNFNQEVIEATYNWMNNVIKNK